MNETHENQPAPDEKDNPVSRRDFVKVASALAVAANHLALKNPPQAPNGGC
jgi:hypothetical protein